MNTLLTSLFAYKAWANAELLKVLAAAPTTSATEPQDGRLTQAVRTLNHTHVVDHIFRAHLLGTPHGYTATHTAETPTITALQASTAACDAWYINYVAELNEAQLAERLRFTFTDGGSGCMTRGEVLMHVITHGSNHRGSITQILKDMGLTPPRDLLTKFLHDTQPQRRTA